MSSSDKEKANIDWSKLPRKPAFSSDTSLAGKIKRQVETELYRRAYRDQGLSFWYKFPNDIRRYYWLLETTLWPPSYWLDETKCAAMVFDKKGAPWGVPCSVDILAVRKWETIYSKLRQELLLSNIEVHQSKDSYIKNTFLYNELYNYLLINANPYY